MKTKRQMVTWGKALIVGVLVMFAWISIYAQSAHALDLFWWCKVCGIRATEPVPMIGDGESNGAWDGVFSMYGYEWRTPDENGNGGGPIIKVEEDPPDGGDAAGNVEVDTKKFKPIYK